MPGALVLDERQFLQPAHVRHHRRTVEPGAPDECRRVDAGVLLHEAQGGAGPARATAVERCEARGEFLELLLRWFGHDFFALAADAVAAISPRPMNTVPATQRRTNGRALPRSSTSRRLLASSE